MGAASGRPAVVRKLAVFLADMREAIGLLFRRSRADVQEELGAYWAALNILVMRGDLDASTPIPVGDHRECGFAGFMSLRAVLRMSGRSWFDRLTMSGPNAATDGAPTPLPGFCADVLKYRCRAEGSHSG